jgi:CHASE2 domain-containing sensor protein
MNFLRNFLARIRKLPILQSTFTFLKKHHVLHDDLTLAGVSKKGGRDLLAVVIVVGLNFGLQNLHFYERYELLDFDDLARSAQSKSSTSFDISIVQIDDDEYEKEFQGMSPLDADLVQKIIQNILRGNPRALAVDLDTSRWEPGSRQALARQSASPIVWSVEPDAKNTVTIEAGERYGIPAFQPGLDGALRTYQRRIMDVTVTGDPNPSCAVLSFPTAVIAATDPARPQCPSDTTEHYIEFGMYRFRRMPASVFLAGALPDEFYRAGITGKVVFLGGTYRAARDMYTTPLNYESGVEVLAHAAQTEFAAPLRKLTDMEGLAVDLFVSVIILLPAIVLGPIFQLMLSAGLGIAFTWAISHYGYQTQTVFLPLCTIFGGVVIAAIVEIFLQRREFMKELDTVRARLEAFEAAEAQKLKLPASPVH